MRIAFLGDTVFSGKFDCTQKSISEISDYFKEIIGVLENCDFAIANLEAPFTKCTDTREAKSMPLKSSPENVELLRMLGITAVCLANNHIFDFGKKGLHETLQVLKEMNIGYFGIDQKCYMLQQAQERVQLYGFCCFSANGWHYDRLLGKGRLNTLEACNVFHAINMARQEQAYPILSFHWGEENTHYPNRNHINIAQKLVEHHATTIVGHHPHVIQGIAEENQGLVAYSLGNFCFDNCTSLDGKVSITQTQANREGLILILTIEKGHLVKHEEVLFVDDGSSMKLTDELGPKFEIYSKKIKKIDDETEYDAVRKNEIIAARTQRLGKRNLKWLLDRLNRNYIVAVVQRKINQRALAKVKKGFETY